MSNGAIFAEMKSCLEKANAEKESIPDDVLFRMMLSGMIQLYEEVEKLKPALMTYKILVYVVSGAITIILSALITGKMHISVVP